MMQLYGYFRSSATYRVRIALNLKMLPYVVEPVHLLKGQQHDRAFRKINPQGLIPALIHDGRILAQSMAIMEYLDDVAPEVPLVWGDARRKAHIRRLSQIIACDTHPLCNLGPLNYLAGHMGADDAAKREWSQHWIAQGLTAFESVLSSGDPGDFCAGGKVSMADCCLVPQMYNARRNRVPLDAYPLCLRIEEACMQLKAFYTAAPESQKDAPPDLKPIHGPNFKGGTE